MIAGGVAEHNVAMTEPSGGPNRTLVGLVAIAFLVGALGVWWWDPSGHWAEGAIGGLVRIGVVIGCLWLALPGRFGSAPGTKISMKLFLGVMLVVAVICWRPRAVLIIIPLLGVIGFIAVVLKPRATRP